MRATPALFQKDTEAEGFQWLEGGDSENSVFAYLRIGGAEDKRVAVILNLTPVERPGYRVGLPAAGHWREILNTDAKIYGGQDRGNFGGGRGRACCLAWSAAFGETHFAAALCFGASGNVTCQGLKAGDKREGKTCHHLPRHGSQTGPWRLCWPAAVDHG